MNLDLSSLDKATQKLREGLTRHLSEPNDEQLRDGLIQRFEFTYELSHKMLKRFLELTDADPARVDTLSFQEIIRLANEKDLLLGRWPEWRTYREMRSRSSHTYDEKVASLIVEAIPKYLVEAEYLIERLKSRIG